jgi:hypothetical protein
MSALNDGFGGYLVLLLIAALAHEPWRWAGLVVGRRLAAEGEIFQWVRAVSTALVAALVARLVLFPAGALESVPMLVRMGAFGCGLAWYFLAGRSVWAAVAFGASLLAIGKLVSG